MEENKLLDDELEEDDEKDELDIINALADKILSSEDQYDDYDEEDEDDSDDEDEEDSDDDNTESEVDSIVEKPVELENDDPASAEILSRAEAILNKKKEIINNETPEETDLRLFGKYEIIYSDSGKYPEKYTKLKEDAKIDEVKHEPADVTINKIKSNIDKYEDERVQIQKFLITNDTEINISKARGLIEACLFVFGNEGLNVYDIKKVTDLPLAIINNILEEMVNFYKKNKNSGLLLVQYGNRFKFVVKSEYNNYLCSIMNKKERKPLSDSVLETLAVIAYNQPCTKGTIEKIRNKSCVNAIERLKEIGLIEADERSEAIGKPWLYSVTQKFFDLYGIKSLSELPMINRDEKNYQDDVDSDADFVSEINEE